MDVSPMVFFLNKIFIILSYERRRRMAFFKKKETISSANNANSAVSCGSSIAENAQKQVKTEAEIAAEKEAAKQTAIAAYKEKRSLTLRRFFEVAELPFPEKFSLLADQTISDFTADPRRLTADSVFMFWGKAPISVGDSQAALSMAIEAGCLFIITNEPCEYENSLYIPDTDENGNSIITAAYIHASHYIRSIHKAKVIALTGSVGKTSTKEMIEAVLRTHYKNPLISKGNNNSMFSITRNIQSLKRPTNVYLQEVGAFAPRTIEVSAKQLEADMAIYTNIGVSHMENYGGREALIADKLSLSTYGKPDGLAFVNYDDETLMSHAFTQKVITYSLENSGAMYYAKNIRKSNTPAELGIKFTVVDTLANEELEAEVFVPGKHNVLNAVVAYAVGKALKLKSEEIVKGIASYRPAGMRQNLIHPCGGKYNVFADCYNSSLLAIDNTLSAMDDINLTDGGSKIAALGDILALGDISEETHRKIASLIASHKVDILLAYGINIKYTVEEAAKLGIDAKFFADREAFESEIRRILKPQDLILFKASHDVNLGSSIDRLFGTDINESSCIAHKQYRIETCGDFEFYIFETSASLKTYLGSDEKPAIPAYIETEVTDELHETTSIKKLAVEKIGKTAFRNNQYVRKIVLPTTVVRVRDGAFKGSSIEYFEGSEHLLSIGEEAFADCTKLKSVKISRNTADIGKIMPENSPYAVLKYK